MLGAVRVLYGPITLRSVRRIIAAAHTVGHSSAPNTHFQPSDAVLDVLYSLFAYHAGFNHGVGFVKPVLERDWPIMNFSRRAVLRAMARVNPEAARVRASGALRGAAKNGVFIAPFFGSLWQSDLNLVLQEWGLIFNSVCDVCTSTWVGLTLITDRLAATVWEDNASVVDVWGGFMPDVWTTDCGTETYVTALACRLMKRWANGGMTPAVVAHRFLTSTRQSIVESRNQQINTHLCLHAKLTLLFMEDVLGVLDRSNPYHKGAVQVLMGAVLQHAANAERRRWDIHPVRHGKRGRKGVPEKLRASHPHPGPRIPLSRGVDFVAEYERLCDRALPREPSWAAERDPLYGQPQQQALRKAAALAVMRSLDACWADVVHHRGQRRFVPAYNVYLLFR